MYNISQFRPALYLLVLLGMSGFALAAESPGLWVLGCGGVLLNGWLVRSGRFRPLPRLAANLVTLGAMLFVTRELMGAGTTAVLVIGQFLVLLQLVKLWEQRANRDYGQLIVLSLLLMVAASINTASLAFGALLVVYLFLSLYCCLLFHLKVETDAAKAAFALPEEKISAGRLRQDQRFLTRSMRRLTGIVSAAAIAMAVIVFLFFPRGTGANMLAPMQFRAAQALTGFSDSVNLDQVARITQNNQEVAFVYVEKNGAKWGGGGETLLLRGSTFGLYRPDEGKGSWSRGRGPGGRGPAQQVSLSRGQNRELPGVPAGADQWKQKITLKPTGTRVLFAIAGPTHLKSDREIQAFVHADDSLTADDNILSQLDYEVTSTGQLSSPRRVLSVQTPRLVLPPSRSSVLPERELRSVIDPKIHEYARRPEVSGSDAQGPLAPRRDPAAVLPHALDAAIADSIERHLKSSEFSYTLDITDSRSRRGQDPFVWFLTADDGKRGHCEYFAGAMTLLSQSMGLTARMVVGFKCDEYNDIGGYFIVRQAHAHAWCEVLTADGWKTYDPTSGHSDVRTGDGGLWQKFKHLLNYVEYMYATNVIAYDNENRENLIQSVEQSMSSPLYAAVNRRGPGGWFDSPAWGRFTDSIVNIAVVLVAVAAAGLVAWSLWQQRRLRQRAARIGLESLPPDEQLRMARQLKFYDDLMQLLGRHKITRPPHLTPMEFARSLMFLPSDAYEVVRRLTGVFYRIRYGGAELDDARQRRLSNVIARVDESLAASLPAGK